jgi:uncharacterized protein
MLAEEKTMRLSLKDNISLRQQRSYKFEIKATGEDGLIEGYGSVFNNIDAYEDVIAKGAFIASLKAHKSAGTMPAMLWQHEADEPLGVWDEMIEDGKGLKVKGRINLETTLGKETHSNLKFGAINGLSIGFVSKLWSYDQDTEIRTLTEIDLWEVSLVTFPANAKARITTVKSADVAGIKTIRQAEKALLDAGFSNDAAAAFIAQVKRLASDERDARDAQNSAFTAAQKLLSRLSI